MRLSLGCLAMLVAACGGAEELPFQSLKNDAGRAAEDAGGSGDAGTAPSPVDASTPDAATPFDAGTVPPFDAGNNELDAGASSDGGTGDGGAGDGGALYTNAASPSVTGPYAVTTFSAKIVRGSRETPVVAHLPVGLSAAPLVIFLPGASLKTSMYLPTVQHLASHGFVVVRADPSFSLLSANHTAMAADAKAVIDWAVAPTGPIAGAVDAAHIGVAGHSLGGKLALMVAASDSRVSALLGIDPVDANTPDVVPSQVTPLQSAMGFLGETVDATGSFMPCAPASGNYTTFYDAAINARWSAEWTFANIGHMDFVDACSGASCNLCNPASGDPVVARANVRTLAAAFFRLHFRSEPAMSAWLTGASVPAAVTVRHR